MHCDILGGRRFYMVKKLTVLTALVMCVTAVFVLTACSGGTNNASLLSAKSLGSVNKLNSIIDANNDKYFSVGRGGGMWLGTDSMSTAEAPASNSGGSAGNDYSKTNIQTEGADEGDIVKADGSYIYVLNQNGFKIVRADNGNLSITSKIDIENYVPQEMFIHGDKLILVGGIYEQFYMPYIAATPSFNGYSYMAYTKTDIRFYDISDRSSPVLERRITLTGQYFTSRIVDGKLYYVVNYYFYYGKKDTYRPKIADTADGGKEKSMSTRNIYYYEDVQAFNYIIFGSVEINNTSKSMLTAYLGLYGELYFSLNNIFVAAYDNSNSYTRGPFGTWRWEYHPPKTKLYRISLADLKQKAATRIDGTVKDRYSLDEYKGYLRVATTTDEWNSETSFSSVFVLDADLKTVGKITDIAPGERIYAVKYNGDQGSIVTFRTIDPLFKLDFSDPQNPTISQGLKEEGVSHYLHFLPGDMLLGIGRDAGEDTSWGFTFTRWKELKVSLYDNSGEDAVNVQTFLLGGTDDAYSEIFYNPKALLYNEQRGLIAFPVQYWGYEMSPQGWYRYAKIKQGLEVFYYNAATKELEYRGMLTNFDDTVSTEHWANYYENQMKFITRGVQIGDYIYTISRQVICAYDIATLTKQATSLTI